MKYFILSTLLFTSIALASDKNLPPPPVQQTVAQQELQAMTALCESAKYANRIQADLICPYFIQKYQSAVDAESKEKDKKVK